MSVSLKPIQPSTLESGTKQSNPLLIWTSLMSIKRLHRQYRVSLLQPRGPLKQNTLKARIATLKGLWNTIDLD